MSAKALDGEAVYSFTLDDAAEVGIIFLLEDVRTESLDVRLLGPDGLEFPIFHAEGYSARRDVPMIETWLEPGDYRIVLSPAQSPGILTVYLKRP
ncbi:MAG: hypothetical protein JW929_13865 [Anaerolineales bacterium]|nr:hypothetical protein [Anaerolineales bacterium]